MVMCMVRILYLNIFVRGKGKLRVVSSWPFGFKLAFENQKSAKVAGGDFLTAFVLGFGQVLKAFLLLAFDFFS